MSIVVIYRFRGTFSLKPEMQNLFPKIDATREGMLFMSQPTTERDDAAALAAFPDYGISNAQILEFAPLRVDLLHTDANKGYMELYEKALREGRALTWFPEKGTQPGRLR